MMKAVYTDTGSGKMTGRMLQEIAGQLPPEVHITHLTVNESQKDGWYWSITAEAPDMPKLTKINFHPRQTGPKRAPMYGGKDEDGM